MNTVPVDIALAMVGGLYVFLIYLSTKMEKIWKAISEVQKDYVEHDVCSERREKCPCWREIEYIKERLKHED
jgi:hypothetical protein